MWYDAENDELFFCQKDYCRVWGYVIGTNTLRLVATIDLGEGKVSGRNYGTVFITDDKYLLLLFSMHYDPAIIVDPPWRLVNLTTGDVEGMDLFPPGTDYFNAGCYHPPTKTIVLTGGSEGGYPENNHNNGQYYHHFQWISPWWRSVAKNTWSTIPGTTYSTDCDFSSYVGVLGRKGIGEYGGFAADRDKSRFLWAAAGGGAGAHSGNDVGEFNLLIPGVTVLIPPDAATSLYSHDDGPESHPLNKINRPNSSHTSESLIYCSATGTLMKISSGQTWEWDAGEYGNVFEAVVSGASMDWEVYNKHPSITGFANGDSIAWRCVDHRDGTIYISSAETKVWKYNVETQTYTDFLVNPLGKQIGVARAVVFESADVILVITRQNGSDPLLVEIDLATGALATVTLSGAAAGSMTYSKAHGLASDPDGNCCWFFKDDGHLYKLVRTGAAAWSMTEHSMSGTPQATMHSGARVGSDGTACALWQGFDYFPTLKGLAWVQMTDVDCGYIRLYD